MLVGYSLDRSNPTTVHFQRSNATALIEHEIQPPRAKEERANTEVAQHQKYGIIQQSGYEHGGKSARGYVSLLH